VLPLPCFERNFFCLMFWQQIWCWLSCSFCFLTFDFCILLGWRWVRFMIFKFLSPISHPHVCLVIVPNWKICLHSVENNTYIADFTISNDDTSLCFGFNVGYRALWSIGNGRIQGCSANKKGVGTHPKKLAILKQLRTHFKVKHETGVGTLFPRVPAPLHSWKHLAYIKL